MQVQAPGQGSSLLFCFQLSRFVKSPHLKNTLGDYMREITRKLYEEQGIGSEEQKQFLANASTDGKQGFGERAPSAFPAKIDLHPVGEYLPAKLTKRGGGFALVIG